MTLVWAGLGNPGPAHEGERHNIGFEAVDAIRALHDLPAWRSRFSGLASEGRIGDTRLMLLKPMTYMNESGRSVAEALRFLKIDPAALTVFHDELDLAPLRLRWRLGGGLAGHNGLRSIARHLGTPEFGRVRIGIGHPGDKARVTGHVLGRWSAAEREGVGRLLDAVAKAAPWLAAGHGPRFASDVALALQDD